MTADPGSSTPSRLPGHRTAVVTGAGGPAGIGRVTARVLAENGWHVALVDINAEGVAGVAAELREAGHTNVLELPTDITSESSVRDAFDRLDADLPPVVGLVNLAGIASPTALHECDLKEFDRVMAVNVTGSFLMLKSAFADLLVVPARNVTGGSPSGSDSATPSSAMGCGASPGIARCDGSTTTSTACCRC
jgi:NAD(P)-dependent dehydrogenase (short-subunit alcohol dehydrogenase family)